MTRFLMPVYDSGVGPYIVDIKAKNGEEAVSAFIEEIRAMYNIEKNFDTLYDLDEYITEEYKEGILILGEIYNVKDFLDN